MSEQLNDGAGLVAYSQLTRRTFLLGAAALGGSLSAIARGLPNLDTPFAFGVASGDPDASGFVLWTRLGQLPLDPINAAAKLPDTVPVGWTIAADAGMRQVIRKGVTKARRSFGHAVHVEVGGLEPARPYWYRFEALGAQSPIGRAVTLPSAGASVASVRLVTASCAHYERGYFAAYRHLAADNPDLILFLGDYIYEYSLPPTHPDHVRSYGAEEATDLAGYRHRYAVHHSDPDLQAAHQAAPWVATWDDHEVQDDYSGLWSSHPDIAVAEWRRRRAAAYRAWWENMPVRRSTRPHRDHARLYRRFTYGDLAGINLLDGRQYRSRQPCYDPKAGGKGRIEPRSCADIADPSRTLLGRVQERWLDRQLERRDTRWTFLAQDLMVAPLRIGAGDKISYWTDTWDGYQGARARLIDSLAQRQPPNPVILSGDYHSYFLSDIHRNPEDVSTPAVATEILGTSITSSGPSYQSVQSVLPANPHIRYFDSRPRGYVLLDVDRASTDVSLRTISDRRDPVATVSTAARFTIAAGEAKLLRG